VIILSVGLVVESNNEQCQKMEKKMEKKLKKLSDSFKQKCEKTGDNMVEGSIKA
jgi:predicted secreted Zn-dependent protease